MKQAFAEFAPDAAKTDANATSINRNVVPVEGGAYIPALAKSAYSGALSAAPRGAISFQTQDGNWRVVAATLTEIFILDASDMTWDSAGSGYTGPDTDENWSFATYRGYLYATNVNDGLQRLEMEAGTTFAAVAGSPPAARYAGVVEDYLVLGALGSDTSAVAWCDTFDATDWSTGNADDQSFSDLGPVMGICGAAKKIIQQRGERYMVHQPGSSVVFAFEKIANARGAIAPMSIIEIGADVAMLAKDGFYFNNEPIGKGKVDRWFFATVNQSRLRAVQGAFDPLRRVFRWGFHTGDAAAFDWQLIYSPVFDRWSVVVDNAAYLLTLATAGLTLGGLAALYATLNDVPYPFGSSVWQGGVDGFAVIGDDNKLSFYEGTALEATLATGEREWSPGQRIDINGIRPEVEGDTAAAATARLGYRSRLQDSVSYTSYNAMNSDGMIPFLANGRYFSAEVKIAAGTTWTHAKGIVIDDYDIHKRGRR